MTTSAAKSPKESLQIGEPSSPSSSLDVVVYREFGAARALPLPNTVSLESVLAEFEADNDMAERLRHARREMAGSLYADEPETLSALRLAAGLSQKQLADLVETSQPHIARIEGGQTDPSTDVVARIARALGVDESAAFRAIRLQRATRGEAR